jgi:hypothetical protein
MNAAYSRLELAGDVRSKLNRMTRNEVRGNLEGLHTLVQAAGALAASGHPVRG